jgi:hypothetical protein
MMKMGSDIEYLDLSLNLAEISSKRSCKMDEQYPAYYQQLTVPMGAFGKEISGQWLGLVNSTNGLSKRWRLQRFPQRTYVPDRRSACFTTICIPAMRGFGLGLRSSSFFQHRLPANIICLIRFGYRLGMFCISK